MSHNGESVAECGFTLLELLIAMTLLGMLMALFSGSVQLGTRVWERSKVSLDETSNGQVLSNFLRDRIEQAVPLTRFTSDASEPIFEGTSDRLRMVSRMPISLGDNLYLIELEHVDDQASDGINGRLVLRWRRHNQETQQDWENFNERTLSSEVADLSISYFGEGAGGTPAAWHQQWWDIERLPALIKIDLAFSRDRPNWSLTLTAAPMVDEWYEVGF